MEIIKGTIRNETIHFATHTKKQTRKQEETIENEILKLQQNISETSDHENIETLNISLQEKIDALEKITRNIQGLILRSKGDTVEHGEKNSKYFVSLEKKRSKAKIIPRLKINNTTNTNHSKYFQKLIVSIRISTINVKWDIQHIISLMT